MIPKILSKKIDDLNFFQLQFANVYEIHQSMNRFESAREGQIEFLEGVGVSSQQSRVYVDVRTAVGISTVVLGRF